MNKDKKSVSEPFVSIVTPVYNGGKYLVECIESVLSQTYRNWEYIIVNNCSTDRTLEIAKKYAEKDTRIRIYNNGQFLSAIENHNCAFHLISTESKYCKVVHADDLLFPECIQKMVSVAEKHPSIGIVGSYAIKGTRVREEKLPYPLSVMTGREVCRLSLLGGSYIFGTTPTSILVRSDLIRNCERVYNEVLYADVEACFEFLKNSDYGFVHQILTYSRVHDERRSSFADRFNTYIPAYLLILKKYGPLYLTTEEFEKLMEKKMKGYYRFLSKSILQRREKEFWDYHRKELENIGRPLSYYKLTFSAARVLLGNLFSRLLPY